MSGWQQTPGWSIGLGPGKQGGFGRTSLLWWLDSDHDEDLWPSDQCQGHGSPLLLLSQGTQTDWSPNNDNTKFICFQMQNDLNKPMSESLRQSVPREQLQVVFSPFALRLGCQETWTKWLMRSQSEHESEARNFGHRALFESYCQRNKIEATKVKRRVPKSGASDFPNQYLDTFKLVGCDEKRVRAELSAEAETCQFYLLEKLVGLQLSLQPLIEAVILLDRVLHLSQYKTSLVSIFDELKSPRNQVLVSIRWWRWSYCYFQIVGSTLETGKEGMESGKLHQLTIKSSLSPEQLRVLSFYNNCQVTVDNKTFISIWKLASLGIPANVIVDLLRDLAKYS